MTVIPRCLAVLDDEPRFRQALGRLLKTHGFSVERFASGDDLIAALAKRSFDCLLLDIHMPDVNGFDLLTALDRCKARLPVIVITGHDQPGTAERVRALGAVNYLIKPIDESALLAALEQAVPGISRR